jgi:hypothetical protein
MGVWIAYQGLQTWRAQLVGKTEYDLARRLLRGVLEVRDQIAAVRGPFMSAGEMVTALKEDQAGEEPNLLDSRQHKKATALAYDRRWQGISHAVADMRPDLLEAEALWGEPIKVANKSLMACVGELNASLVLYFRALDNPRALQKLGDRLEQYFDVIYQTSDNPAEDAFTGKVGAAVDEFEKVLRPYLALTVDVQVHSREVAALRLPPT